MKLKDFDFYIPEELIAQNPLERRDSSRMLVLHRNSGKIEHRHFHELPLYLRSGDTMVFNQSKVIKARLLGKRASGGKVEAFLLKKIRENVFECLLKMTASQKVGVEIEFGPGFTAKVLAATENPMLFAVEFFTHSLSIEAAIDAYGKVPLPPYIHREPEGADTDRYQTVYASQPGSVAAPTAGLHYTPEIIAQIKQTGIDIEYVTLHVGLGTFQPIKCENIEDHNMHDEVFVAPESLHSVGLAERKRRGRIIAVGTTSVRALESAARGFTGVTNLFLKPGSEFKAVDALFTNFHQPKSSLIVMLTAFVGDKHLLFRAYEEAVREKYRFFSYGDCMLVL